MWEGIMGEVRYGGGWNGGGGICMFSCISGMEAKMAMYTMLEGNVYIGKRSTTDQPKCNEGLM